jgi:hypothetical protein
MKVEEALFPVSLNDFVLLQQAHIGIIVTRGKIILNLTPKGWNEAVFHHLVVVSHSSNSTNPWHDSCSPPVTLVVEPWDALIVKHAHEHVLHNGVKETLAETKSKYFARKIVHECVSCRKFEGQDTTSTPTTVKEALELILQDL